MLADAAYAAQIAIGHRPYHLGGSCGVSCAQGGLSRHGGRPPRRQHNIGCRLTQILCHRRYRCKGIRPIGSKWLHYEWQQILHHSYA